MTTHNFGLTKKKNDSKTYVIINYYVFKDIFFKSLPVGQDIEKSGSHCVFITHVTCLMFIANCSKFFVGIRVMYENRINIDFGFPKWRDEGMLWCQKWYDHPRIGLPYA